MKFSLHVENLNSKFNFMFTRDKNILLKIAPNKDKCTFWGFFKVYILRIDQNVSKKLKKLAEIEEIVNYFF